MGSTGVFEERSRIGGSVDEWSAKHQKVVAKTLPVYKTNVSGLLVYLSLLP